MYNYGDGVGVSSQDRQYQGYPYTSPMVIDVPTIDAATAARWTNLPRRPWVKEDNPVVYIDLPSSSQSSVSQPNTSSPPRREDQDSPSKVDPDENPVVYIDLPENNGSDVAERRRTENEESFVQETIFYDPFKDRRIEVDHSDSEGSTVSAGTGSNVNPNRPTPPNTLDLGSSSRGQPNSNYPSSFSKESSVYRPVSPPQGFPEPPPAYTEVDTSSITPGVSGTVSTPESGGETAVATPTEPARTQVIISPESNPERKLLYCIFCGLRGHSLIVKQPGFATHVLAVVIGLLGLIPLLLIVYCTDYFKYNNHYCKNCNEKIAYEIPWLCKELSYA